MANIFEERESQVRSYCRKYPVIFDKAVNSEMYSVSGERYIDFLSVAGSMNYGHNNPEIKSAIMNYLREDNIINALDMYTKEKEHFFSVISEKILNPRQLNYKIMCCGPTGTNAVEAALKLARKNKKRKNIIAFSGAFHGMSLGSLALTTDRLSREGANVSLNNVSFVPYESEDFDSIKYLKWILEDDHSGIDKPAAIILETVQAEGGVNVASVEWLQNIRKICTDNDILMIVDDIQVGNCRSGYFFSFERAGIVPDIVILSKSISGFGMPMALVLMKPELDIFSPAEHNGTFRGNQLAFVGGSAAIKYCEKYNLPILVREKSKLVEKYLKENIQTIDSRLRIRGIGLIWGIDFNGIQSEFALDCVHKAFERHLIMEVAGRKDGVLKIMPPLTIPNEILLEGLQIIEQIIREILC